VAAVPGSAIRAARSPKPAAALSHADARRSALTEMFLEIFFGLDQVLGFRQREAGVCAAGKRRVETVAISGEIPPIPGEFVERGA
jgi:hypothetical protein